MTLATRFLARATNTDLTLGQELSILAIAMLTSKSASGVTSAGFITLAASLAIIPDIPIQSLTLLVGVDKFMSERSEEHTSELQSLMRISYAVFCLKKKILHDLINLPITTTN